MPSTNVKAVTTYFARRGAEAHGWSLVFRTATPTNHQQPGVARTIKKTILIAACIVAAIYILGSPSSDLNASEESDVTETTAPLTGTPLEVYNAVFADMTNCEDVRIQISGIRAASAYDRSDRALTGADADPKATANFEAYEKAALFRAHELECQFDYSPGGAEE